MTKYSIKTKVIILITNLILWLGLDQWTKILAVEHLKLTGPKLYLSGIVQLIYAENNGAWGNLGGTWGEPWKTIFLVVIPVAVLVAISVTSIINKSAAKLETWSYVLIACGGLGNIVDRIRFGYVVDFMYVGLGKWPFQTNIFNIADVIIMTGFGVMILQIIRDKYFQKNLPSPDQ
jgi:signal peptidase II